jgi:hypothetical protein
MVCFLAVELVWFVQSNVTHVLEGSVRREGEQVRLTLQLIDARGDVPVWSHNFDRRLRDTLALQSEVARNVATQLAVKLSGKISEFPPSASPQAYDLYLRARMRARTVTAIRSTTDQQSAEMLLNSAIELDPGGFVSALIAQESHSPRLRASRARSKRKPLRASPKPGRLLRATHRWVEPSIQRQRSIRRRTSRPSRGTSSSASV